MKTIAFLSLLAGGAGASESGCPCITPDLAQYRTGGTLTYEPSGSGGKSYNLPDSYGSGTCAAHDDGLEPYCADTKPPSWCQRQWCYVDSSDCAHSYTRSVFFPDSDIYFSYESCGSTNTFSQVSDSSIQLYEIVDRIEAYTCATKLQLEQQLTAWALGDGDKNAECAYLDSCPCTDCVDASGWNQAVSLKDSVLVRPASCSDSAQFQDEQGYSCRGWYKFECDQAVETWGYSQSGEDAVISNCPIACEDCATRSAVSGETECLAQAVRDTYARVASSEYGDFSAGRVGYQYYGLQGDGTMVQWPSMQWCPTQFDPRFRPWYAAAATGPKAVMLVLDASGSMCVDPSISLTDAQRQAAADIEQRVSAKGGSIVGEIVISLGWSADVDLDIHVTTPDGTEIFYGATQADNGYLDVDCLRSPCGGADPIENIAFSSTATERLLRGTYKIEVNVYSRSGYSGSIDAVVSVKSGGCLNVYNLNGLAGRQVVTELAYGGVDAPGTTGLMSRMGLARQAASAVLDTLTEADFAGIVSFDGCTLKYSETMVRVTDDNRERMKHWVNHLMPGSTTNYAAAFESAFEVLSASSSDVLACPNSSALIFLTDGRPDDWTDANLARVRELNANLNAAILTYTLGDDIDAGVVSQLACENDGVYKHVSNLGELDAAMAGYYHYFASVYRGCEGSLRWLEYTDSVTCERLLAGCMPVFDGTGGEYGSGGEFDRRALYGVTCMDANMIASLSTLQADPGWSDFETEYTALSRTCGPGVRPDLAAMRSEAGQAACAAVDTSVSAASAASSCTKQNPMEAFREFTCTPAGGGSGSGGGTSEGSEGDEGGGAVGAIVGVIFALSVIVGGFFFARKLIANGNLKIPGFGGRPQASQQRRPPTAPPPVSVAVPPAATPYVGGAVQMGGAVPAAQGSMPVATGIMLPALGGAPMGSVVAYPTPVATAGGYPTAAATSYPTAAATGGMPTAYPNTGMPVAVAYGGKV